MRFTSFDVNDALIPDERICWAFSRRMSGVQVLDVASKSKRTPGNWQFCRRRMGGLQFSIFNQRMYLIAIENPTRTAHGMLPVLVCRRIRTFIECRMPPQNSAEDCVGGACLGLHKPGYRED